MRMGQFFLVRPLSKTETRPSIPTVLDKALVHEVEDPVTSLVQGSRPARGPTKHPFHPTSQLKPGLRGDQVVADTLITADWSDGGRCHAAEDHNASRITAFQPWIVIIICIMYCSYTVELILFY